MKKNAPGAVVSLVCGIISMVLSYAPVAGLPLGIVALVQSKKASKLIDETPYTYKGRGLAIGGLVCGILGTFSCLMRFV